MYNSEEDIKRLIQSLEKTGKHYDIEKINKAYLYANDLHEGQFRNSGEAYISQNADSLDWAGFDFVVDDLYKNNVILIQKGDTELLEKVNAALAKALSNDYYTAWYEVCEILAGSASIDELGYDENGNKITE